MVSKVKQLHKRVETLIAKFNQGQGTNYINEAIVLDRETLELCPPGHLKRSVCLDNLAIHLGDRYRLLGAVEDLTEAIAFDQEALALRPPGHRDRSVPLNNLAVHLGERCNLLGSMEDLNKAIILAREALALSSVGHSSRSKSLNNLAAHLSARYKRRGAVEDLNEAIVLDREALAACALAHPDPPVSLNNLAVRLSTRYEQLGSIEDLNEAIALDRIALQLRSQGHPDRPMSLNNLAAHLASRCNQLGAMEDLNEAISLTRELLALSAPRHSEHWMALSNLAIYLGGRYKRHQTVEDLDEAIDLGRDALVLSPPGHPDRPNTLNNLATCLSTRFRQLGKIEDINEAITLDRDALALRPTGHPDRSAALNNLAVGLANRFNQLRTMEDIDEAIVLSRGALAICPHGHPKRPQFLNNLASWLSVRLTRASSSSEKQETFTLFSQLADVDQMVSSTDLSATRTWILVAEELQHPTTVLAYETSLRLLTHHLATLPTLPQHLAVLKDLTSSLSVDAFSACLRRDFPTRAVELLEQGRGVFWNQLSRLRSPLDDIIASGPTGKILADKFTLATSLIQKALNSSGAHQHDLVCRLNISLQRVVASIRELPGMSRFLLPSLFSDLQQAACKGPVIIVNASKYSCDALIVFVDQDPVHIPMSITKVRVRELSSRLRTLAVRAKSMNMARELATMLRELWDEAVSPIVDFLLTTYPPHSRIWWCPTAEFSLLPLHAAGPYRKGQKNLADLYISSYTPTLTALIRARRRAPSGSAANSKCFVAIGQGKAIGENDLLSVGTELANISQRIDGLATFTSIEGPESFISRVAQELCKTQWVHLACHGIPNPKQPFDSAFALHDGHFTIERIIQCELDNPEFAYLSACHTTVGDEESPDEVIHLASAMQFAGFRSVIGTMWAVDDAQTNKITSVFYDHMVDESGRLDHTRAAYALNKTMRTLVDVPFDQRILYIHLGA